LLDPQHFDPRPCHHQHFGASLAATAHANRLAGGAPDVPDLEDEALVRALEHADLRERHDPHVRVLISSRLDGRAAAPSGFRKERPIAGAWTTASTTHICHPPASPGAVTKTQLTLPTPDAEVSAPCSCQRTPDSDQPQACRVLGVPDAGQVPGCGVGQSARGVFKRRGRLDQCQGVDMAFIKTPERQDSPPQVRQQMQQQ